MIRRLIGRFAVYVWPPLTAFLAVTYTMGQSEPIPGHGGSGVLVTPAAMGLIAGMIVIVGPAFWWAGRYENRLVTLERTLDRAMQKNAEANERAAAALEAIAENGSGFARPGGRS